MLLFEINLPPRPQKQTKFCIQRGRAFGVDLSKSYKQQIQWQVAPHAPKDPLLGPIQLDLTFYLPIPSKTSKVTRQQMINGTRLPVTRPDIDNLAYVVTNALKSIVYDDDSQIVDLTLRKRYGEVPRTIIKVIELNL